MNDMAQGSYETPIASSCMDRNRVALIKKASSSHPNVGSDGGNSRRR